jgi:DNA-binding beta-propeller fold protein YncE
MREAILLLWLAAAGGAPPSTEGVAIPLPTTTGALSLDYLAADRARGRVWIPAGSSGSVDVLDLATRKLVTLDGFATAGNGDRENARRLGPNGVSLGDGLAFIGNRATPEICAIDATHLTRQRCLTLPVATDGVQYVPVTREVWVTAPSDRSLALVAVAPDGGLRLAGRIPLPGEPEGYAMDESRGRFFTNLEDKDRTLVLDVRSRKVLKNWPAHCGADGPRGLAYDPTRQFLFIACTEHVEVLDVAHDGGHLARLDTGAGVDNIDYLEAQQTLYVAAGRAARLTVARVSDAAKVTVLRTHATARGARVVVVAADGTAVVGDPGHGGVLVFPPNP